MMFTASAIVYRTNPNVRLPQSLSGIGCNASQIQPCVDLGFTDLPVWFDAQTVRRRNWRKGIPCLKGLQQYEYESGLSCREFYLGEAQRDVKQRSRERCRSDAHVPPVFRAGGVQ